MVFAGECGGSAVPVLVLDMVPAKHGLWVEWMLEVWGDVWKLDWRWWCGVVYEGGAAICGAGNAGGGCFGCWSGG